MQMRKCKPLTVENTIQYIFVLFSFQLTFRLRSMNQALYLLEDLDTQTFFLPVVLEINSCTLVTNHFIWWICSVLCGDFILFAFLFNMEHTIKHFLKVFVFCWVPYKPWAYQDENLDETSNVGQIGKQAVSLTLVLERTICVSEIHGSKVVTYLPGWLIVIVLSDINYLSVGFFFFLDWKHLDKGIKHWYGVLSDENVWLHCRDRAQLQKIVEISAVSERHIFGGRDVVQICPEMLINHFQLARTPEVILFLIWGASLSLSRHTRL